jgi:hypothetical protein
LSTAHAHPVDQCFALDHVEHRKTDGAG